MAAADPNPAPPVVASAAAARADEAYEVVAGDPHRADALAREALQLARGSRDAAAESAARRALGMAALELDRADTAVVHLQAAVRTARRAGDGRREANARTSLALALVGLGAGQRALRQANAAVQLPTPTERGPVHLGRALVLERLGRLDEALDDYREALAAFRRGGDRNCEARTLCDRGVLQTYRGELNAAEADLRRADSLCRELGLDLMAASVRQNLGFVAAQRGDVPAALSEYDRVHETFRRLGGTRYAILESDRCQLLLSTGLVAEARASADRAIMALEQTGMGAELAEVRLLRAEVALAERDWATAGTLARHALRSFSTQHRPNWAALARHTGVRSAWELDGPGARLLEQARHAAHELDRHGWVARAAEGHLLAAQIALAVGRTTVAKHELRSAAGARRRGPALVRITGWHAEALRRETEGQPAAARRAVARGLRVLDEHRATLGATELRSHAAARVAELAGMSVRLALASGRPADVLVAVDRVRARTGELTPVRPPRAPELAAALSELRAVTALMEQEIGDGRPSAHLLHRQAHLEREIRRRVLQLPGLGAGAGARLSIGALRACLADRALIEFLDVDGRLHAVTVTRRTSRLHALGPFRDVVRELEHLHFAMRRLASPLSARIAAVHRSNAAHAARRLQALVLDPLAGDVGDREVVLVPTGSLHAMTWAALPALANRPLVVAPSAALWLRAAQRKRDVVGRRPPLVVSGPGLPHADGEAAALARLYGDAVHLHGRTATVDAVAAALQHCDRAHLACHGRFRGDNPLFSSLVLADGPLTVHDLESLAAVPSQLVLSSCDSGRAVVRTGDELIGLSSSLLALGADAIVASTVPVPDALTKPLMIALHRRLRHGDAPAEALRAARTVIPGDAPGADVARTAFVCFGAS